MNASIFLIALSVASAIALGALIQEALRRARRGVHVCCPLDWQPALVRLDPQRATRALFFNESQRVIDCDRWPDRAGCGAPCAKRIEA